jgi:hypothetical protein
MKSDLKALHELAHKVGQLPYVQQLSIELHYGDKETAEALLDEFFDKWYNIPITYGNVAVSPIRCKCCDKPIDNKTRSVRLETGKQIEIAEDMCNKCIEKVYEYEDLI